MTSGLQSFGEDMWIVGGTEAVVGGFRYPTRMVVIRLADGGLFLWSPVAFSDPLASAVSGLGDVRHLVAPNSLHHLFLEDWRQAFPLAKVHGAPGLAARRPDLRLDAELGDQPPADWETDIDQVLVGGNLITTEAVFHHRPTRTVIFTDLIQHFDPGWFRGWRAVVAGLDLMTAAEPSVPRKFRTAFTNRNLARRAVRRILAWPCDRVLMAHGAPVDRGGDELIARAFAWLKP